jgi:tetratricopeptide (TPR) repeat protein
MVLSTAGYYLSGTLGVFLMANRQAALAALQERVTRAGEDLAGILGPEASRAAEAVLEAVADPSTDLEAAYALGWYHWARYQALPEGQDEDDLAAATRYLSPVYRVEPDAVPEPLRHTFDEEAARNPNTGTDPASLNSRGIEALNAFKRTGQHERLDQAVVLIRAALSATPEDHPDHAVYLNNLGITLARLFDRSGGLWVLAEAVEVGRAAVAAVPEGHPVRAGFQNNLGLALRTLFEGTGDLSALVEAVELGRVSVAAIPEDHLNRAGVQSNLAATLLALFERTGDLSVLVEAVEFGRASMSAIPEGHPQRVMLLNNLAIALRALFERTGDLSVLTEAVESERAAVAAIPEGHPDRSGYLSNLGVALRMLFERTGQQEALVEAVEVGRAAVAAVPQGHPNRAGYQNNLGGALQRLSERTGELGLLAAAMELERAAASIPADHADRAGYLNSLGHMLLAWFERTGQQEALVEAVEVGRAAVAAVPEGHPNRAVTLSNLGGALQALFERAGQLEVLVEAVEAGRAAVDASLEGHPNRAEHLSNLGGALQALFERTGQLEVLVEAVEVGRAAVDASLEGHPNRSAYLNNLGIALRTLFERTGQQEALDEARRSYRQVASSAAGATIVRITAYRELARLAADAGEAEEGLQCMEAAVDLVETLAPGSLARTDREHQLGRLADLAGECAAAALQAGRPERAVELLERTRGILAADTLGIRGDDMNRLHAHDTRSHLADRLEQLRDRLDTLDRARPTLYTEIGAPDSFQAIAEAARHLSSQRRETHDAWQTLLEEIRALPGFTDFFHAPTIAALARHADDGPIVFISTSPTRSDALVLTDSSKPVQVIPLTRLTQDAAHEQADRLLAACRTAGARDLDPVTRQDPQHEILTVLAWLWDTIAEPVLTHLGYTTTPTGDTRWPRIWWCPVGVLAYLPLHAAGHHTPHPALPRTVPDLVVSSYTPTVRALAHARTPRRDTSPCTTLLVPVPDLPGAELPGVTTETDTISTLIPDAFTLARPTRASVLSALPTHRIAHFSCHGYADWEQPARSRLFLTDHATAPLTLADITPLHLDADLAYLSACDTAVTAPRMADESLHITGAFHLAGYRHVIGTLWPINDHTAAEIAEGFYTHLTNDGTTPPQPDQAAYALHHATVRLRDQYPTAPVLWAAHTHTGT